MCMKHQHPAADEHRPRVALIAHDSRKEEMAEWAAFNRGTLAKCTIFATATTGRSVTEKLDLPITMLLSGPLGGDAQVGALIHTVELIGKDSARAAPGERIRRAKRR